MPGAKATVAPTQTPPAYLDFVAKVVADLDIMETFKKLIPSNHVTKVKLEWPLWELDPPIRLFPSSGGTTPPPVTNGNWADVADTSWYTNNPDATAFTISTAEQLAGLAKIVNGDGALRDNFSGKTITLTADINLAGREWTPIGKNSIDTFRGIFDGSNRLVSNLTITGYSVSFNGLFGYLSSGGDLRNVKLAGVSLTTTTTTSSSSCYTGGLVGYNSGGTITDSSASGSVSTSTSSYGYTGGLVGYNSNAADSIVGNFYDRQRTGQAWGIGRDARHNNQPSDDGAQPM
jgi:hypothetical protein